MSCGGSSSPQAKGDLGLERPLLSADRASCRDLSRRAPLAPRSLEEPLGPRPRREDHGRAACHTTPPTFRQKGSSPDPGASSPLPSHNLRGRRSRRSTHRAPRTHRQHDPCRTGHTSCRVQTGLRTATASAHG